MKHFILCLFFLSASSVFADDLKKKHEELFRGIDHVSLDFTQTVYKKLRNRSLDRNGTAHFSKPNMFRWNFTSAKLGNEEFYYNGKVLTHFREAEKTVTNYNTNIGLAKELNEVVNLVLQPQTLYKRYDVIPSEKAKGKTQPTITLKPKAPGTDIRSIEVGINEAKKYVSMIKIEYLDGNYTKFGFKNPKFTPNSLEIFSFSRKGKFKVRNHG